MKKLHLSYKDEINSIKEFTEIKSQKINVILKDLINIRISKEIN